MASRDESFKDFVLDQLQDLTASTRGACLVATDSIGTKLSSASFTGKVVF